MDHDICNRKDITGPQQIILLNRKDNVATVVGEALKVGRSFTCNSKKVEALSVVPFGHKVALTDIPEGGYIYKYGEIIGKAKQRIRAGEHVHTHNVEDAVDELRHTIFAQLIKEANY